VPLLAAWNAGTLISMMRLWCGNLAGVPEKTISGARPSLSRDLCNDRVLVRNRCRV
jgi:hypothetical protein